MQTYKLAITLVFTTCLLACIDQQNQIDSSRSQELDNSGVQIPAHSETTDTSLATKPAQTANDQALPSQIAPAFTAKNANLEHMQAAENEISNQSSKGYLTRQPTNFPPPFVDSHRLPSAIDPVDRENYQHIAQNTVKVVAEQPISTFSVDVDTAAYSNLRRMLNKEGRLPPADAVKLEEMINYFSYSYDKPDSLEQPFSVNTEMAPAPWNTQHQLLQIGLKGFEPAKEKRPAANLVFLVDVSGSMHSADKLGLVKKSLRLLVNQMQAQDRIALAVYAGAAGMVLESTSASKKATILAAIDSLESGGSTNGGAGIQLAYDIALQHKIKDGINRVIIASDGDMNVGTTNIHALKNLIEEKRKSGISLTTLGFGSGNYNYALMEQMADVGNGNAAYIDTLKEAQKVLVEQMQSTLLTIAKDVKIQIEFNPAIVAQYRLIGYENRLLNREDFRNDNVDAGDIGAGHTVTALYELTLVGSESQMIAPRRYGNVQKNKKTTKHTDHQQEVAFVRLRYKNPQASQSIELSTPILVSQIQSDLNKATSNLRFASAVAGFGQILKGGKYTRDWGYDEALRLARSAKGDDYHGYRGELISLVELAKSLSTTGSL